MNSVSLFGHRQRSVVSKSYCDSPVKAIKFAFMDMSADEESYLIMTNYYALQR